LNTKFSTSIVILCFLLGILDLWRWDG